MKINGVEVDFKISRLKDASAFEKALENMQKAEIIISKKEKQPLSVTISGMTKMYREFMRDATGVDVLDNCDDLEIAMEVYYQFCNDIKEQKTVLLSPFSPDRIK